VKISVFNLPGKRKVIGEKCEVDQKSESYRFHSHQQLQVATTIIWITIVLLLKQQ